MKLATFNARTGDRVGIVDGDEVIDLTAAHPSLATMIDLLNRDPHEAALVALPGPRRSVLDDLGRAAAVTRPPDPRTRHGRPRRAGEQGERPSGPRAVYGVIIEDGAVNAAATAAERGQHRGRRRERSRALGGSRGKASLAPARRLDDNLVQAPAPDVSGRIVACQHCAEILSGSDPDDTLALAVYEGLPAEAGPQIIANPADYVDTPVVFPPLSLPGLLDRALFCRRPSRPHRHDDHPRPTHRGSGSLKRAGGRARPPAIPGPRGHTALNLQGASYRDGQRSAKLPARADVELGEHLAQVPFDGALAEEEPGADFRVGQALVD
jgi:hypothetical protein